MLDMYEERKTDVCNTAMSQTWNYEWSLYGHDMSTKSNSNPSLFLNHVLLSTVVREQLKINRKKNKYERDLFTHMVTFIYATSLSWL